MSTLYKDTVNNNSFYVSSQGLSTYDYGIEIKTQEELILQAQQIVINTFGANANLDPSTPNGFLVQQITNALIEKQNEVLTCYNNLNPDLASGQFLDSICAFNQIYRKLPTQSSATLVLTGLPNTFIPAFSQVINENGDIYYTPVDLVLDNTGNLTAVFYSEVYGQIPINGINRIYDTIDGWDTVNNALNPDDTPIGTVGINIETDYTLRNRRQNSVNLSASGSYPAIQSGIYSVSGVTDLVMAQNIEGTEQTIPNMPADFKLKPNSIFAVIDYNDNSTISTDLANVFYEKKSGGCVLQNYGSGAKTQNIDIPSSPIPFIAKWNKAEKVDILVKVTLSQAYKDAGKYPASRTQTLEEIVQDIIFNNYQSGVNNFIGETIYPSTFIEILSENGISYIIKVETAYKSDGTYTVDGLTFFNTQISNIESKTDIVVNYI